MIEVSIFTHCGNELDWCNYKFIVSKKDSTRHPCAPQFERRWGHLEIILGKHFIKGLSGANFTTMGLFGSSVVRVL